MRILIAYCCWNSVSYGHRLHIDALCMICLHILWLSLCPCLQGLFGSKYLAKIKILMAQLATWICYCFLFFFTGITNLEIEQKMCFRQTKVVSLGPRHICFSWSWKLRLKLRTKKQQSLFSPVPYHTDHYSCCIASLMLWSLYNGQIRNWAVIDLRCIGMSRMCLNRKRGDKNEVLFWCHVLKSNGSITVLPKTVTVIPFFSDYVVHFRVFKFGDLSTKFKKMY